MKLDVHLYKLQTLLRLFANRSFSATAQDLGLSQSAVSQHIQLLESELGVTLVNRRERPLRPTEAGQVAVQYAREILGRIEEMESRLAEIREAKAGKMAIGASTSVGVYLLPEPLARFKALHPGAEIVLRIAPRAQVYADLAMSASDFAYVLALTAPPGLVFERLRTERLVFVCSPQHPLARRKRVRLGEVAGHPFVTARQDSDYVAMANEILRKSGVERYPIAMELDNMEAVKRSIALNLGIGFLPLLGVQREIQEGKLREISVEKLPLHCVLALVHRKGKFFTPVMAEFMDSCRESLLSDGPQP